MKDEMCEKDIHCWEPLIVFSSMVYIRKCVICGIWKFRDKLEETNEYWIKKLEKLYDVSERTKEEI
jgi:hypothetical protein